MVLACLLDFLFVTSTLRCVNRDEKNYEHVYVLNYKLAFSN